MTQPRKLTLEQVNDLLARVRLYAAVGDIRRALALQSAVWALVMDASAADHPLRSDMIALAYACSMRTLRLCMASAHGRTDVIAHLRRAA